MKKTIEYTLDLPEEDSLFELFLTTGWNSNYKLSASEMYLAAKNSWYHISAYEGNKLVGFGRIICDGIVHALILDLIVDPQYQKQGIGQVLLDKIVKKCKVHNIRDIQLFSAKGYTGFYKKRGFRKRPDNAPGMELMKSR